MNKIELYKLIDESTVSNKIKEMAKDMLFTLFRYGLEKYITRIFVDEETDIAFQFDSEYLYLFFLDPDKDEDMGNVYNLFHANSEKVLYNGYIEYDQIVPKLKELLNEE